LHSCGGPPEALAGAINEAQLTERRLREGLIWALGAALLTLMLATGLSSALLIWSFDLLSAAIGRTEVGGFHLYAPASGEWAVQSVLMALCVGAFISARRSVPFLAHYSRHAEYDVWRIWAPLGAAFLGTLALLTPVSLDPLNGMLLLGLPAAWVLGTRRPAQMYGEVVAGRSLLLGIAGIALLLVLPAGRVWVYQTNSLPGAQSSTLASTSASLQWDGPVGSDSQQVVVDLPQGWHDATIELWPADRLGPVIVPGSVASRPSVTVDSGVFVYFDLLPPGRSDWWVTVTAVGPDGNRRVIYSGVHYGAPAGVHTSIVGWLIGLL